MFAAGDSSATPGELDQIHFWEAADKLDFGLTGSQVYTEITVADYAAAQAQAATLLGAGTDIVAAQVGSDVVVFVGGDAVAIVGANLSAIDVSNFVVS